MKRAHIVVHGLVQGVFYRAFVRENALLLGLTGWARNLPGGSVEIVAEGDEEDIKEFLMRLRKGSSASRVDKIDVKWSETKKEFSGFDIVR
jgi:acylphosphatase